MLTIILMIGASTVHPQVTECAAAVRSQSDTTVSCADPKVVLFPGEGEEATPALTTQCASALLAGRAVSKVPANRAHFMRADFEKKMAACEASVSQPAPPPKKRETTKLWD